MNNQYILPIIVALITSVLGPILIEFIRKKIDKTNSKTDPIFESLEVNKQVDNQLDIILNEVEADRVWISQFHNGGNFYPTGKSIQKFSVFYEHVTPNTETIKETFSNIPTSLFTKPLSELYDKHIIKIPTYKNPKVNTFGLENYCSEFKTKSTYIFSLYNLQEQFLGTLGIEFCKNEKILIDEDIEYLQSKASAIGTILNTYLYTNITKK
jgi:hypothetical protein